MLNPSLRGSTVRARSSGRSPIRSPADGFNSSMSPDGRHLAFSSFSETPKGRTADIWLLDLERGVPSLFTSDAMFDLSPVWAPDGRTIAFASNRARSDGSSQSFDVYLKPVDGAGREEFLVGHEGGDPPSDWSADGRFILYNRSVTRPDGAGSSRRLGREPGRRATAVPGRGHRVQRVERAVLPGWQMGRLSIERIWPQRSLPAAVSGPWNPDAGFFRRRRSGPMATRREGALLSHAR